MRATLPPTTLPTSYCFPGLHRKAVFRNGFGRWSQIAGVPASADPFGLGFELATFGKYVPVRKPKNSTRSRVAPTSCYAKASSSYP
jgi:hypothetical protein